MTEILESGKNSIKGEKFPNGPGLKYCRQLGIVIVTSIVVLISGFISLSVAAVSVEDIIRMHLSENYPWENIEVTNIRTLGELGDVVPERINVEKGPIGKAVFAFYTSGRQVMVKADITAYDWIVKSKRPFDKGHVIAENDIYVEKIDIDRMPRGALNFPDKIIGKSLKRSIIANIPIVENMVEKYQVVKRGKMVDLIIGNEGFSISVPGKTKEKGYIGKPIRAENLSSKKIVTGVLIDARTVKVAM